MKKFVYLFYRAPLHIAVDNQDIEIIKLLLSHKNIDVNIMTIKFQCFHEILLKYLYGILLLFFYNEIVLLILIFQMKFKLLNF